MQGEGMDDEVHARGVVHGEGYGGRVGGDGVMHGHLLGREVDAVFFGSADDGAAEVGLGTRRGQADLGAALRR